MSRPPAAARPASRTVLWLLAGVMALAAALRVVTALRSPLWFDEIYVVLAARRSLPELLRLSALDIHPPLVPLLRQVWQHLGGEGVLWMKSLSIALALGGILAGYALGRRMFGPRVGLIAAALMAVDVVHVRYSQEVQFHSMLWLLLIGAVHAGWCWVEDRRGRDAARLVALAALALYTHYLAGVALAVLLLWGLVALRREPAAVGRWLLAFAVVALLFLPQAPVFLEQFRREGSASWFRFPRPRDLLDLWRLMSLGPRYLVPPLLALSLLPLFRRGQRRAASLLWALSTLTLLATRVLPVVVTRDLLCVLPFWHLLVAMGIADLTVPWLVAAVPVLLVGFGLRSWLRYGGGPEGVPLARATVVLGERTRPGDLVVCAETHALLFLRFYLPDRDSRLLMPAGSRAPYSDGGLVVENAWYLDAGQWAAARARDARWWGVRVDRAVVTRGVARRAGSAAAAAFDAAAPARTWDFPPVRVWEGAGAERSAAPAARPPADPRRRGP
ncbi:MAG: glycosyltransferase family 39 protein [Candidatus Eisenbacteria bacterium]|nr:glycosyltransferase family 39 protein [Candidatus Eisenbacteria bacterium]